MWAVVDFLTNVTGMVLGRTWCRINSDNATTPLLCRAIQFAPNVGLSTRLNNSPASPFRILDRFSYMFIGMVGHQCTRDQRDASRSILRHNLTHENRFHPNRQPPAPCPQFG
jgi:hypothetical protein